MPKRQVIAKTNGLLLIDPAGGTDWQLPICLTSTSLSGTTATNNSSTFCGDISQPGDKSVTISLDGAQFLEPETAQISFATLFDLWQDTTIFSWKLGPETPVAGDVVKTGMGYLSAYGETNNNSGASFNGTIAVSEDIVQTITGS